MPRKPRTPNLAELKARIKQLEACTGKKVVAVRFCENGDYRLMLEGYKPAPQEPATATTNEWDTIS